MSRLTAGPAIAALLALAVAGGQGGAASGASSGSPSSPSSPSTSLPSPSPGRARSIAIEQSRVALAERALGLARGERLVVRDVITDPDGSTHVRYDRTFNGLRVIGGDFVSHRDSSGSSKGVSWNGAGKVAVASTKPRVSLDRARAVHFREASLAKNASTASRGELVVYSGPFGQAPTNGKGSPRLAYDVLTVGVRADQTPSRVHAIVDATTGAVLASWDEIETGSGHSLHVGVVNINTTAGPTAGPPWSMRDAAGNSATDLNGIGDGTGVDIFHVPGTTFTDADNIWGDGTIRDRASAGVDALYGAEKTFDFYKKVLGRNGIGNDGVGARSRVHYGNGYLNAFWDGVEMTYGDGAGNTHPLVELDVAGHEMTHGVTQRTAGLAGVGEAGGLNEATSDIFGTAVEWYAFGLPAPDKSSDTPDYLIGELIDIFGNGKPLRYLDRPSRDGFSPDCWSAAVGGLDAHDGAGPLNHWFYLASEGSGAKLINGMSYNSPTCNGSTVTPIGRQAATRIWYRTLATYLTSGSTYAAAREGAIRSAKDLYGASSAECIGVAASFSAIAVPSGATTCGTAAPPGAPPVAAVTRLSDFNRDGITDLVARDSLGRLWLYPGNGAGSFKARHQMATGWRGMTAIVTPGDVTADGNADILARDSLGRLWLYPGNGASGLSSRRLIGAGWNGLTITDGANLNGVGRPDLLARTSTGALYLYPLSGNAVFGRPTLIGTGWSGFTITGPGDLSGDTRADILARNRAGDLRLYRGNGAGRVAAGSTLARGWAGMTALVTPGNWNRALGNDLLARDAAGGLWFYPGNNSGGFDPRRQIGSGWSSFTYLG